jgi:integrase
VAFLFGIECGMRRGEIQRLKAGDISGRTAVVHKSKNGDSRQVPLSKRALELIALVKPDNPEESLFGLSANTMNNTYCYARKKVAERMPSVKVIRFHDARREATTRLSKKLNVLELAKSIGHRDLKSLLHYYAPETDELAEKLD